MPEYQPNSLWGPHPDDCDCIVHSAERPTYEEIHGAADESMTFDEADRVRAREMGVELSE